jgi:hypothetical protein
MQKSLIFCFLVFPGFCLGQELGLRYGAALADDKELITPIGAGIFLISDDSAKRICVLLSFDLFVTSRVEIPPSYLHTERFNVFRFRYSFGILRVFPVSQHIKLRIGPSFAYQKTNGTFDYNTIGLLYSTNSNYIVAGIVLNLKFERLFHSGVNFDSFLSPEYLFFIHGYNRSDVRIAGFNMGISF